MGMFVGISKNLVVCGYTFYKLKNREQKIAWEFTVSHFFRNATEVY